MEYKYKSQRILALYVLTSITSGLFHWAFGTKNTMLLGSSGYLFALIGLHTSSTLTSNTSIPITFLLAIAIFLGEELFLGITKNDGISRCTHITGGAVGIMFSILLSPNRGKKKVV